METRRHCEKWGRFRVSLFGDTEPKTEVPAYGGSDPLGFCVWVMYGIQSTLLVRSPFEILIKIKLTESINCALMTILEYVTLSC